MEPNESVHIIEDMISFLAIEIEYIQICLKYNFKQSNQQPLKRSIVRKLEWTADKINLVELIYALFFANCINNGETKIKNIMEAFEEVFSIDLGEYYRSYVEIKRRKIIRGKFLKKLFELMEVKFIESDKK